ncbi:MAG TPA: thiamine pyrophosphate-binding protein, partial [Anaerolineae bacterium]|nr:thiamine pyrophosphate-binding protein [Anaerolineae bacterium]
AVFSDSPGGEHPGRDGFEQMDDWLAPVAQFTKWAWQVDNPGQVGEMTRRAIKVATTPPGGPVHIRLPNGILAAPEVEHGPSQGQVGVKARFCRSQQGAERGDLPQLPFEAVTCQGVIKGHSSSAV